MGTVVSLGSQNVNFQRYVGASFLGKLKVHGYVAELRKRRTQRNVPLTLLLVCALFGSLFCLEQIHPSDTPSTKRREQQQQQHHG